MVIPPRERVLVLRALGLGDLLTAVPALRALRRRFADHQVVLAAPRPLVPLVHLGRLADSIVATSGLSPIPWSGPPPAVAVNLHGRGPESHGLLKALRPGRLMAFGQPLAGHDGPRWRPREREVERWCRLLREYDVPADPDDLCMPLPRRPPRQAGVTVIHPGAGRPDKQWGAANFAMVATALERTGHHVVITGEARERPLADDVARRADLPADRVLAGALDLVDLAALVASARLVVCGDTGVGHLATAYATESVLLFGPEDPAQWGPPDGDRHVVIRARSGDVKSIRPGEVIDAARGQGVLIRIGETKPGAGADTRPKRLPAG